MTLLVGIMALVLASEIWSMISVNGTLFVLWLCGILTYVVVQYYKHRSNKTSFRLDKFNKLLWIEFLALGIILATTILIINRLGAT